MPEFLTPFTKMIDLDTGVIPEAVMVQKRYLNDLKGLFIDSVAEAALMSTNPLLYEVHEATDIPDDEGQLRYSTTIIFPGKVGEEYFFTKGHYHAIANRAELYFGLAGEGYLLLQTPDGTINAQRMVRGAMAYVPPYWAHRTINVGSDNFVFLAAYNADAGYDYASIAARGFAQLMVERDGKPTLVPSPKWAS
ncbi:MAG: glucose-6-phosphate isomerase family protein [Anaerolineae bacterium]